MEDRAALFWHEMVGWQYRLQYMTSGSDAGSSGRANRWVKLRLLRELRRVGGSRYAAGRSGLCACALLFFCLRLLAGWLAGWLGGAK